MPWKAESNSVWLEFVEGEGGEGLVWKGGRGQTLPGLLECIEESGLGSQSNAGCHWWFLSREGYDQICTEVTGCSVASGLAEARWEQGAVSEADPVAQTGTGTGPGTVRLDKTWTGQ